MRILTQLLPETLVNRPWPVNMPENKSGLFVNEQNIKLSSVNLVEFEHVGIDSSGILMKRFSVFSECLIWSVHKKIYNFRYAARKNFTCKHRRLSKNSIAYLCFDYWSNGYFHWITEALPRIFLIEENLKNRDAVLLLPGKFKSDFHSETLLAFPNISIEWIGENELIHCSKCRLVGRVSKSGSNNPTIVMEIRNRLISKIQSPKLPYRNVYVSRSLAARRKVKNEEEVEKVLSDMGFEIIHFEHYSFIEQMHIANETLNYVSLHGANLTNAFFMEAGSNMLEFRMRDDPDNNYYYALATACHLNYYFLSCEFTMFSEAGNNFDIKVDISELQKIVLQMLNK